MAIALISHYDCQLHDMGHHHPEQPARLAAINDRLIASGLEMVLHQFDAPEADRELLTAVHDLIMSTTVFSRVARGGHRLARW
jgi:acetoin utilization deacetylase AcuC-like enzyme